MEVKYLEFAKEIAIEAGKIMIKYFNQDSDPSYKFDKTLVTKADLEINEFLINKVKETFPTHSVDGEEKQFGKSDYVWVCDPVDGTAMYAKHIPVAVFSLALVVNGEPIIGVAFDPFTNNMYTAIKGKGAFKNDKKIEVNNYNLDDMECIGHCDLSRRLETNVSKVIAQLRKKTYLVDVGSIVRTSMCISTGDFTFSIFTGKERKNCDIAAIKVIVEEAGGKVTDLFGNEQRYDRSINGAIITNGIVHKEIVKIVKRYLK